jgi:hypothetical protein
MKLQIPNTKLQRNPKLQGPKRGLTDLDWSLSFGASLELGAWNLELSFGV